MVAGLGRQVQARRSLFWTSRALSKEAFDINGHSPSKAKQAKRRNGEKAKRRKGDGRAG
jgi:hypothetical protein